MELAKLFATVGFKVEKDGLDAFRKELAGIKTEVTETAKAVGNLRNVVKGMNAEFRTFKNLVDPSTISSWRKNVLASASDFYRLQQKNSQTMVNANHWADQFISNIARLHTALQGRQQQIMDYSNAIGHLAQNFYFLKEATAGISRFRQVPSSLLTQAQGGTMRPYEERQPRSRGSYESNQYVGYWGRAEGFGKSPMAAMLRPMLPTGMGLFNAVAAGYGIKELVNTGREMMQLELMLKTVSGSTEAFNDNLEFTRKISNDLGIDVQNLTESYAKFYLAGKPLFARDTLQDAFKGTQSYFRLLGMTSEKIKLANKAIEQMMNKQRVNAEELKGQLAEHATGALQAFADAAAGGDVQKLFKMMEDGKVNVDAIVGGMQRMGQIAANSPELDKMLKLSGAEQGRFENQMKNFSKVIMESGLDELLAEMFKLLTALVKALSPFIILLVKAINGLKLLAETVWENKAAMVALMSTAVLGGLGKMFLLAGLNVATFNGLLLNTARAVWATHGAMISLFGVFAGFIYVFKSIDDYLSGDDNWLHAWELSLEIAMTYWDEFALRVQLGWLRMKKMFEVNPLAAANNVAGGILSPVSTAFQGYVGIRDIIAEGIKATRESMGINFTDDQNLHNAPKQFMLPQPQPVNGGVTVNVDISKLPQDIQQDAKLMGEAMAKEINAQLRYQGTALRQ